MLYIALVLFVIGVFAAICFCVIAVHEAERTFWHLERYGHYGHNELSTSQFAEIRSSHRLLNIAWWTLFVLAFVALAAVAWVSDFMGP